MAPQSASPAHVHRRATALYNIRFSLTTSRSSRGSEGGGEPAERSCQAGTGVWALKHLTWPCLSLSLVNFHSLALLNLRQAGIGSFQLSHLFPLVYNSDHTLNKKKVCCQKGIFFCFLKKTMEEGFFFFFAYNEWG